MEDTDFLKDFEREVLERLITIETKIDGMENLKKTCYDNEKKIISLKKDCEEQDERLKEIEDTVKWLWRAIAGVLITAVGTACLQYLF